MVNEIKKRSKDMTFIRQEEGDCGSTTYGVRDPGEMACSVF